MTRSLPRPVRLALLPLGLAVGLLAEWTRLSAGWPPGWAASDFAPGAAFLVAGVVAWERRPDNRVGQLMVAIGFTWFAGTFQAALDQGVAGAAYALQGYYDALLAWLVLSYPTGHLRWLASRVVVGAFFAVLVVRTLTRLVLYRPSTAYDFSDPVAVDAYIADLTVRETIDGTAQLGISALAVGVLVLIAARVWRETSLSRQVAAPLLVGGLAFGVGVLAELAVEAAASSTGERLAARDLGQVLTVASAGVVPIAFLLGLARMRQRRAAVAELVVDLGDGGERPALREILARTVRDPSLELAYAVPGSARFVDAAGNDVALPAPGSPERAATRIERGHSTVAMLLHDPALLEQQELIRAVAAAAGLALENERLAAEVRRQLGEVQASRARIVAAGDAERRRVERDLHDGAQQRLVTLALTLELARGSLNGSNPHVAASLAQAGRELEVALAELRELARGLHPTVLTEEGLGAAVEALADRSPVPVRVSATAGRYPPQVEATAWFVVAEALTNVAKYAEASQAHVVVEERDDVLRIEVRDDGRGGADPARGSGLRGLDDRVAAAGGRLEVTSRSGAGTVVMAEIPCA